MKKGSFLCTFAVAWSLFLFVILFALLQTVYWSFVYHGKQIGWYDAIAQEMGVWESLESFTMFAASLILLISMFIYREGFPSRVSFVFPSFFCALFFIAAGEELDWGQHIFQVQTPEAILSISYEGTLNLHGMRPFGFNLHEGANIFLKCLIIGYAGILPFLSVCFWKVDLIAEWLSIPLPHVLFVPFACFGVFLDNERIFSVFFGEGHYPPPWSLSELRETLFAFTVLGGVILNVEKWKKRYRRREKCKNC